MGAAMTLIFRALHSLHKFWSQKSPLSLNDLQQYKEAATLLGEVWKALGWKVSTWVHWVVRHSHALAVVHRNLYVFSSIPTERRNVEFKLDVTHCFKGWKLSKPYASTFGFAHVLNLSALDLGIVLYQSGKRGMKNLWRPILNDLTCFFCVRDASFGLMVEACDHFERIFLA